METADGEVAPASPTTTNTAASPVLALTASSSSSGSGSSSSAASSNASSPTTTEASGSSSPGSTPESGSGGGSSSSGGNGAFRDLFEACRNGDVSRVKKLVDTVNVNAKDMAGRKSTPLHFAAGKYRKLRQYFLNIVVAVSPTPTALGGGDPGGDFRGS